MSLRQTIDEEERLAILRRYDILDTPPEAEYDVAAELLRSDCNMTWAAITLVDRERQWFKAHKGFGLFETARSVSFCSVAMHLNEPLIVEDARLDRRFAHNTLVTGEPNILFYAGIPLVSSEGYPLGAVCIIDMKPRTLFPSQLQLLSYVRDWVQANLELRRLDRLIAAANACDLPVLPDACKWRPFACYRIDEARKAISAYKAVYDLTGPMPVPCRRQSGLPPSPSSYEIASQGIDSPVVGSGQNPPVPTPLLRSIESVRPPSTGTSWRRNVYPVIYAA